MELPTGVNINNISCILLLKHNSQRNLLFTYYLTQHYGIEPAFIKTGHIMEDWQLQGQSEVLSCRQR